VLWALARLDVHSQRAVSRMPTRVRRITVFLGSERRAAGRPDLRPVKKSGDMLQPICLYIDRFPPVRALFCANRRFVHRFLMTVPRNSQVSTPRWPMTASAPSRALAA